MAKYTKTFQICEKNPDLHQLVQLLHHTMEPPPPRLPQKGRRRRRKSQEEEALHQKGNPSHWVTAFWPNARSSGPASDSYTYNDTRLDCLEELPATTCASTARNGRQQAKQEGHVQSNVHGTPLPHRIGTYATVKSEGRTLSENTVGCTFLRITKHALLCS